MAAGKFFAGSFISSPMTEASSRPAKPKQRVEKKAIIFIFPKSGINSLKENGLAKPNFHVTNEPAHMRTTIGIHVAIAPRF